MWTESVFFPPWQNTNNTKKVLQNQINSPHLKNISQENGSDWKSNVSLLLKEAKDSIPNYLYPKLIPFSSSCYLSILMSTNFRLPSYWHTYYLRYWLNIQPISTSYLITLIVLGERYKLWSSALWSFLHSPILISRFRILF